MNTVGTNGSDEAIEEPKKKRRGRPATPKPADGSRDAKRLAALVLEVLAGARTPGDAAGALGVSIGCYYNAETRAIAGLVAACEPLSSAQRRSSEVELATLKKENERLQRDAARHLALARVAQRTIGVSPKEVPPDFPKEVPPDFCPKEVPPDFPKGGSPDFPEKEKEVPPDFRSVGMNRPRLPG